jgi:hypothetical protein
VFRLKPSEHLSQNEIDAAMQFRLQEFNSQNQPKVAWQPTTAVAKPTIVAKPRDVAEPEPERRPSDKARLQLRRVISGNISPKSVASSQAGYVTAQNMMYRHSVTVYDARTLRLVKTISDAVNLRRLGYPSYPGTSAGCPGRGCVLAGRQAARLRRRG